MKIKLVREKWSRSSLPFEVQMQVGLYSTEGRTLVRRTENIYTLKEEKEGVYWFHKKGRQGFGIPKQWVQKIMEEGCITNSRVPVKTSMNNVFTLHLEHYQYEKPRHGRKKPEAAPQLSE